MTEKEVTIQTICDNCSSFTQTMKVVRKKKNRYICSKCGCQKKGYKPIMIDEFLD